MSKILLVEDDATMRMLLKTLLEIDGHQVELVIDPKQDVRRTIMEHQPNVLIMDVHLRYQNGIEILRSIHKQELPWKLYILMASGMDLRYECLQAGADGFLMKPYMPEELTRQLIKAQSL
jgi:CheY-like chemotaxis protein